MFEQDLDSDDDFEGYFLRPVNEYNIVDKIKEANKELFETKSIEESSIELIQTIDITESIEIDNVGGSVEIARKVKFRENLVDYEPELEEDVDAKDVIVKRMTSPILESAEDEIIETCSNKLSSNLNEISLNKEIMSDLSSENEIEEIFEEINCVDIENTDQDENVVKIFDNIQLNNEHDNDNDNKTNEIKNELSENSEIEQTRRKSTDEISTTSRTSDDDLSIIVASYVVEDRKAKFIDDDHRDQSGVSPNKTKSIPKIGKSKKVTTIKTCCSSQTKEQHDEFQDKEQVNRPTSDILKLRLNYKTCCEYKNSIEEQLPRYSGYYSQYGLSKEQWEKRDRKLQSGRKKLLEKSSQLTEEKNRKMEDNEQAFVSWLKNKMRFPINKTKNMFDFKSTRVSKRKRN